MDKTQTFVKESSLYIGFSALESRGADAVLFFNFCYPGGMTRRKSSGASKREVEMRPGADASGGAPGALGPRGGDGAPEPPARARSPAPSVTSPTLLPASSNETVALVRASCDLGSESTGGGGRCPTRITIITTMDKD